MSIQLRKSEADEDGNIGISREALKLENLAIASAVKANGGTVIVQVEKKVKNRFYVKRVRKSD